MTTSPSLQVRTTDPTPPYEQLRRQLVELIQSGVLGPGDRLPPLRQLAADLGLAVGTLARTYRELESEGLVQSRRGGGTRVQQTTARRSATQLHQDLQDHADRFVQHARRLGATDDQVHAAVSHSLGPKHQGITVD